MQLFISVCFSVSLTLAHSSVLCVPQQPLENRFGYDRPINKVNYWNKDIVGPTGASNLISPFMKPEGEGMNNLGVSRDMTEQSDQSKTTTPYKFIFQSKDQTRYEVSDEKGNVKGSFTFLDKQYGIPKTVQYEAGVTNGIRSHVEQSPPFIGPQSNHPFPFGNPSSYPRNAALQQWGRQIGSLQGDRFSGLPVSPGKPRSTFTGQFPFNAGRPRLQQFNDPINSLQRPCNPNFSFEQLPQNILGSLNYGMLPGNPSSQLTSTKPTVVLLPPVPVLPLLAKGTQECQNEAGDFVLSERCMQASNIPSLSPQFASVANAEQLNTFPFPGGSQPMNRLVMPGQQLGNPGFPLQRIARPSPIVPFNPTLGDFSLSSNAISNVIPSASYNVLSPNGMMHTVGFSEPPTGSTFTDPLYGDSLSGLSNSIGSAPLANVAQVQDQLSLINNRFNSRNPVGFPFMVLSPDTTSNAIDSLKPTFTGPFTTHNFVTRKNKDLIGATPGRSKGNVEEPATDTDLKKEPSSMTQSVGEKSPDSDYEVLAAIAEKISRLAKARNSDSAEESEAVESK